MTTCDTNEAGTFTTVLQNQYGCDSLVIAVFDLLPSDTTYLENTVCDSTLVGHFKDTLQNQYGCDSLVITDVLWSPEYMIPIEVLICEGDSVFLEGAYQYESGIYVAEYTTAYGCDSTVVTELSVMPGNIIELEDQLICLGDTVELMVEGVYAGLFWTSDGDLSCDDCPVQVVSPETITHYTVSTTNCRGDEIVANATVYVELPPTVSIIDEEVNGTDSTKLSAQADKSLETLLWSGSGVNCPDCETITVDPNSTSIYILVGASENGCKDSDDFTIERQENCVSGLPLVANIIMPDGDGYNDYLELQYEEIVSIEVLRVYNRWGELIFETHDMNNKWDGTFRGKLVNPGVYVYYVSGQCPNQEKFFRKGNVTLLY